jgi:hypothetical protein
LSPSSLEEIEEIEETLVPLYIEARVYVVRPHRRDRFSSHARKIKSGQNKSHKDKKEKSFCLTQIPTNLPVCLRREREKTFLQLIADATPRVSILSHFAPTCFHFVMFGP